MRNIQITVGLLYHFFIGISSKKAKFANILNPKSETQSRGPCPIIIEYHTLKLGEVVRLCKEALSMQCPAVTMQFFSAKAVIS
jgi:hypothetical protein